MTDTRFLDGAVVRVRTYAEGMLAKLAHDLELEWPVASIDVMKDGAVIRVQLHADAVRVVGACKGELVEPLSSSDQSEIRKKLLASIGAVLRSERSGPSQNADISADITLTDSALLSTLASRTSTNAKLRIEIPTGHTTAELEVSLRRENDATHVTGTFPLSLRALGVPEVKGPFGAFRLKDRIDVTFHAALAS